MAGSDRAGGDDGFLARWSQRKRAVREAEAAEEAAAHAQEEASEEELDEATLAANRAAAEAIDLDDLAIGSDMSAFCKAGVPAALKKAAFNKLWRSHPVFAVQDGLDIYRENFNDPSYLLTGGSSWVPGSGYAQRIAELKEQAKQALEKAEKAADSAAAPGEAEETADTAEDGEAIEAAAADPAEGAVEAKPDADPETPEDEEPAPRVPLRSRLDFAAFKDS